MTNDIDELMDGVYKNGEISIDKEKVSLLNIFMQRAFPAVSKKTIADASALLAVYCCLLTEGKRISVNDHEMDAEAFNKFFDTYAKKSEGDFESMEDMYSFYGSALVVALFVYQYTSGLTSKDAMFHETRGGDTADRIADAIDE